MPTTEGLPSDDQDIYRNKLTQGEGGEGSFGTPWFSKWLHLTYQVLAIKQLLVR